MAERGHGQVYCGNTKHEVTSHTVCSNTVAYKNLQGRVPDGVHLASFSMALDASIRMTVEKRQKIV